MKSGLICIALFFLLAFTFPESSRAQAPIPSGKKADNWLPDSGLVSRDSAVLLAIGHEIRRATDSLKLPGLPAPYFLAFTLWDMDQFSTQASLGSVEQSGRNRQFLLDADVRVGEYSLDNTLYQGGFVFGPTLRAPLPQDGDTLLLRQAIWALTDARYKVALEMLAQKKAFLAQTREPKRLPDLTRQAVLRQVDRDVRHLPDTAAWAALCKRLSARLTRYAHLLESRVAYQNYYTTLYYTDAEGASFVSSIQEHTLVASLLAQAEDGTPLWDFFRIARRDSLPLKPEVGGRFEAQIGDSLENLAKRLETLVKAPPVENYRGPILFAGQAAGDLIHRALILPQMRLREPLGSNSEPDFLTRLRGHRYLPAGLDLTDNPALKTWRGRQLFGTYRFDHQGQKALPVTLVEDGRLKEFYQGKIPIFTPTDASNGHWRYGGGFPGVVRLTAKQAQPESTLIQQLRHLAADEGLDAGLMVLRTIDEDAYKLLTHPLTYHLPLSDPASGRGSFSIPAPCAVDRVEVKTGSRSPARGLVFPPVDSKSLRDLAGVGNEPYLLEPQASFSLLCPPLLFSLLDMKHPRASQPRLPYLPPTTDLSNPDLYRSGPAK